MTRTFTHFALAAALVGAVSVPASGAFAASKTERALLGAVIGGVAGAALTHGGTEGVVVGAAAGAALGVVTKNTGRHHRYSQRHRTSQPYYSDGYGQYDRSTNGAYDNRYDGRYDNRYDPYASNDYRYGYGR